ncbi:electron transfer flavoprotein subunit alpha/FixB family protein [Planctomycetota bacterium]
MACVLVIAEQRDGKLKKASFEATSVGKKLAGKKGCDLCAVVIGQGVAESAPELAKYGADKIFVVEHGDFDKYSTEGYGQAALKAIEACDPEVIMLPATALGKDLGPYLAAKLDAPLATDITEIEDSDELSIKRPVYAGKVIATVNFPGASKVLLSLRPNVFEITENAGAGAVTDLAVTPDGIRAQVKEVLAAAGGKIDLTEAEAIVSGGRGMKDAANFSLIEELADVLGASVGASRAVVDAGWRPHSDQVGQTGKLVIPNLYIACGISGAIQHLAGMNSSKVIVAINKDADAPIFSIADYGIIGDAMEVLQFSWISILYFSN